MSLFGKKAEAEALHRKTAFVTLIKSSIKNKKEQKKQEFQIAGNSFANRNFVKIKVCHN